MTPMLQNKPANAITHRALTHAWFSETKAWDKAGVHASLSPLGKGATAPNGNFASPNSTQKHHTSCTHASRNLYPRPCPPWRTWLHGWNKQTDTLASNLCLECVDPLGTVVMIRIRMNIKQTLHSAQPDIPWFSHETVIITVTVLTDWAVSWRWSLSCMRQQLV